MSKKKKPMPTKELIKEISEVTQLKTDIVKSVIDAFGDIMLRECVMNGTFKLHNGFSVDNHIRKERKQYNVQVGAVLDYPETTVLSISLAPKINNFYRWKQRHEFNEKHGLTVDDWRALKQKLAEEEKNQQKKGQSTHKTE